MDDFSCMIICGTLITVNKADCWFIVKENVTQLCTLQFVLIFILSVCVCVVLTEQCGVTLRNIAVIISVVSVISDGQLLCIIVISFSPKLTSSLFASLTAVFVMIFT